MKALLVEDDHDVRELVAIILKTKLAITVQEVINVHDAMQAIQAQESFDLIISDYHLPDGTGGTLYQALQSLQPSIPFILCSSYPPEHCTEFQNQEIAGFIQKPFDFKTILSTVNQILKKADPKIHVNQYFQIPTSLVLKTTILPCDLLAKTKDDQWITLAHAGECIDHCMPDFSELPSMDYFYIQSKDIENFLEKYSQDLMSLSCAKTLPFHEALEKAQQNFDLVQKNIQSIEFKKSTQSMIASCANLAMRTIQNDPITNPLFQSLVQKKNSFLSTHSMLLVSIACYLADIMNWKSENIQYQLALASFLHDITISDETLGNLEVSHLNHNKLQTHHSTLFQNHSHTVAQLAANLKLPEAVIKILKNHHERPDGTGFPNKISAENLGPLESLFIIAHDFTLYCWIKPEEISLKEFIEIYENDYQSHYFEKILKKIKLIKK